MSVFHRKYNFIPKLQVSVILLTGWQFFLIAPIPFSVISWKWQIFLVWWKISGFHCKVHSFHTQFIIFKRVLAKISKELLLSQNSYFWHPFKQMLYRLVWLLGKSYILTKSSVSMYCLLDTTQISKELSRSLWLYAKMCILGENVSYRQNEQNEHISMKLQISLISQKRAFHRLVYLC